MCACERMYSVLIRVDCVYIHYGRLKVCAYVCVCKKNLANVKMFVCMCVFFVIRIMSVCM